MSTTVKRSDVDDELIKNMTNEIILKYCNKEKINCKSSCLLLTKLSL